jgi:hypothetical protein
MLDLLRAVTIMVGWYHFVGTLAQNGEVPPVDLGGNFTVWMSHDTGAPRLSSLKGMQVVQVNFGSGAVPWRLDEPEME